MHSHFIWNSLTWSCITRMNPTRYTRNSSSNSATSSLVKLPLDQGFRKMAVPAVLSQPWICKSPSQPEPWFCAQVLLAKDDIWMTWKEVGPWKAVGSGRIRKVRRKREAEGNENRKKTRKTEEPEKKNPEKEQYRAWNTGPHSPSPTSRMREERWRLEGQTLRGKCSMLLSRPPTPMLGAAELLLPSSLSPHGMRTVNHRSDRSSISRRDSTSDS